MIQSPFDKIKNIWIKDYLSNRKQQMCIGDSLSSDFMLVYLKDLYWDLFYFFYL